MLWLLRCHVTLYTEFVLVPQEEEKEREEKDGGASGEQNAAAREDAMNANQSPESEYDRDREVMQRCVKLILQGRQQIILPHAPKVGEGRITSGVFTRKIRSESGSRGAQACTSYTQDTYSTRYQQFQSS